MESQIKAFLCSFILAAVAARPKKISTYFLCGPQLNFVELGVGRMPVEAFDASRRHDVDLL